MYLYIYVIHVTCLLLAMQDLEELSMVNTLFICDSNTQSGIYVYVHLYTCVSSCITDFVEHGEAYLEHTYNV